MDFALIIMLLGLLSFGAIYFIEEYLRRKEENSIPKPVDNNIYRVMECTIDDNKTYYLLEQYYFSDFRKMSSWDRIGRYECRDFAIDMCNRMNNKRKEEFEEKRITQELDNTKNKKLIA